jgi:hypothetical protein
MMDKWTYRVYGLRLRTNRAIPGLIALPNTESFDVSIEFCPNLWEKTLAPQTVLFTSPAQTQSGEYFLKVWRQDDIYYIRHTNEKGYVQFKINSTGSQVQVVWSQNLPENDMVAYLLGPVLGCVLRLRQITCLHAGVVAVGNTAIAIIGPKGAGKSTSIAFLAQQGHAVLTDDIAPLVEIDGQFFVQPGYPRLRLWPNTIEALGLNVNQLPPVLSFAEKRYLNLTPKNESSQWQFQPEPLPLTAIYLLDTPNQEILINPLPQRTNLISLVRNTYADYMLDRVRRQRDFEVLGRLATTTVLRQTTLPNSLEGLPQFYEAILKNQS